LLPVYNLSGRKAYGEAALAGLPRFLNRLLQARRRRRLAHEPPTECGNSLLLGVSGERHQEPPIPRLGFILYASQNPTVRSVVINSRANCDRLSRQRRRISTTWWHGC